MRRMRWLICSIAFAGMAQQAVAADLPFLRGSNTYEVGRPTRWDGVYFGGQFGMNINGVDFTDRTSSLRQLVGRAVPGGGVSVSPLGSVNTRTTHFGGFAGYNIQMDGAVIGVEANYNWFDTPVTATSFVSGTWPAPGGLTGQFTGPGSSTARLVDYGTFRVRGGWAAGSFMPYATVGLAVGRADISRTATMTFTPPPGQVPPPPVPLPITVADNHPGLIGYGYALGVGVDYAVIKNLFIRAEYEYVQFNNFDGLNVHLHNVRAGAAYKF